MKHNRPVNYLCWLKRLNCRQSAIPRTTFYRMRRDMRPFLRQRQNRSQFPIEPIQTTTNIVEAAHNVDHNEQRLRTENDSETGDNTDDYSVPEQDGDCEGDFDQDGNEEIGPSSTDVTKGSVLSLVFAIFVRHRLTKGCLGDLLQLLNIIVPNCVPKTNYFFEKLFFTDTVVKQHFYCPDCQSYLGEPSSLHSCTICQIEFEEESLLKSRSFFFSSSIEDQLRTILENDSRVWDQISANKQKSLFQQSNFRGEIYTGDLYKTPEIRQFLFSGDNFTMATATDGIRPFKASKLEIWPIFCTINELDFNHKSRHVLLSSLWCGPKKPKVETYFIPFLHEVENLFINGLKWTLNGTNRLSKVIFPLVIADAPARAMLSNAMQFNAFYGCGYCLHKGETVEKGSGMVRVFPLSHPIPDKRTHEKTFQQAVAATHQRQAVQGIKGPSILFLIPFLNVITGVIPDVMHCAYLGVVSQFIKLWLGSVGEPYYIPNVSVIDDELSHLKVPNEILRDFRKMADNLGDWKASEFRNFLLFYSPVVLKKLLPQVYYKHWLLFVGAMRILLQKTVPESEINVAQLMIYKFVALIPELYGKEHVSYNVHVLLHVTEGSKHWGAPWACSAFLYEDAGGLIKRLFHGSNSIAKQIFRNYLSASKLRDYSRHFIPLAEESVRKFYEKLDGPLHFPTFSRNNRILTSVIGSQKIGVMAPQIIIAIERKFCLLLGCHSAFFGERFAVNGKLFTTKSYCSKFKKDNSIIWTNSPFNKVNIIGKVISIHPNCTCTTSGECLLPNSNFDELKVYLYCDRFPLLQFPTCYDEFSGRNLTSFMKVVDRDNISTEIIVPSEIRHKCLIINRGQDDSDICIPCNIRFEKD